MNKHKNPLLSAEISKQVFRPTKYPILFLFLAILFSLSACHDNHSDCIGIDCGMPGMSTHDPIYLSYADLRSSISVEKDRKLEDIGKVCVYRDFLFVNSRNKGVFIYDNSNPSVPLFVTFISIPGNIDIAIKDSFLYVDSYIDLVVIDIRDAQNIREVERIENVFPYNPYQNIPQDIFLTNVDVNKGVVVGYKEKNNDTL